MGLLIIIIRHHVYVKAANQVELAEVGPRFEMRRKFLLIEDIDDKEN